MNQGSSKDRGDRRSARPELQLHLSPPPVAAAGVEDQGGSSTSTPSSCVSSDGSPGSKSAMVIGACTRCLVYCMVAKKDYPTCINCKQPCLSDVLHDAVIDEDDMERGKRR